MVMILIKIIVMRNDDGPDGNDSTTTMGGGGGGGLFSRSSVNAKVLHVLLIEAERTLKT